MLVLGLEHVCGQDKGVLVLLLGVVGHKPSSGGVGVLGDHVLLEHLLLTPVAVGLGLALARHVFLEEDLVRLQLNHARRSLLCLFLAVLLQLS